MAAQYFGGVTIQEKKLILEKINKLLNEQYSIKNRPHWFQKESKLYDFFVSDFCYRVKDHLFEFRAKLYPSNYWKLMMLFDAAKDRNKNWQKLDDIKLTLFDYQKELRKDDAFFEKKSNIILNKIDESIFKYSLPAYYKAQIFGLSEMLFFRLHDFIYNVHGPYILANNTIALIYEFDLFDNPINIKNNILGIDKKAKFDLPNKFKICSVYDQLDAEIDIFNNLIIKSSKHKYDLCDIDISKYDLQKIIFDYSEIIKKYNQKNYYIHELAIFWSILNNKTSLNEKVPLDIVGRFNEV